MSNVGKELKKEREVQGKTRAEVAKDIGIYAHHLAALEHGNFDELPDDETVAGFVETYARYLGFLPAEPVAEFWAERGKEPAAVEKSKPTPPQRPPAAGLPKPATTAPRPVTPPATRSPYKRPVWHWVIVAVAVILVLIWFRSKGEPDPEPVGDSAEATAVVETTAEEAAPAPDTNEPVQQEAPAAVLEPAPVEPEPEPEPLVEQPTGPAPTMSVTEHGVGSGVENRALVGETDRFRLGDKVWFWTWVRGGGAGDEVRHVWIYNGRDFSSVTLSIGSASWRTQSAKTMFDGYEGSWAVEARDVDGNVLARSEFTCEP